MTSDLTRDEAASCDRCLEARRLPANPGRRLICAGMQKEARAMRCDGCGFPGLRSPPSDALAVAGSPTAARASRRRGLASRLPSPRRRRGLPGGRGRRVVRGATRAMRLAVLAALNANELAAALLVRRE